MPTFTFVRYEGSDSEIRHLVTQLMTGQQPAAPSAPASSNGLLAPSPWDEIAKRFESLVAAAVGDGRPGQKQAMEAWLRAHGKIPLVQLWKAAGVKVQHDYGGIGGSLTKNMIKAGGPQKFFQVRRDSLGQRHYEILPELVDPLKRAFRI